jgi:hypothetical protein
MLTGEQVQRNLAALAWPGLFTLVPEVAIGGERSDRATGLNSSTASKVW